YYDRRNISTGNSHWHLGYNTTIFIYLVYPCCYFQLHPLQKAGYAGWKSLIPIYNLYIQQCIAFGYEKRWFILFLLIPLAGPLYGIYLVYNFGRSFGLSAVQAIFYVLLTPILNLYIAFNDGSRYQGPQEFFID
ncbi:TPA: DUF5684 domain-containing protein, partial [Streptococcus suis]